MPKMQREYSFEPTANVSEKVSGEGKRAYLWNDNGKYSNILKLQGEYSIEPTANPVRNIVGRWQVSIFVDFETEVG